MERKMIKLKQIIENLQNDKSVNILVLGLKSLISTSHLVSNQIESNIEEFIQTLDIDKFKLKIGKITKFFGSGAFGSVYKLNNGKAMKITFDYVEAPFLYKYCINGKTKGLVTVDSVYKFEFGKSNGYIIIRDEIQSIKNSMEMLNSHQTLDFYEKNTYI